MDAFTNLLQAVIGPDGQPKELTLLQLCLRAFIIFLLGLAMVRVGDRRSLSEKTGFDTLFLVLIGAILARAVNGSAAFLTTLGCAFFLMLVHRVFAFVAFRSHPFGNLIKGDDVELVRDGKVEWRTMKKHLVSKHDLEEDLRLNAATEDINKIKVARLERSGDISFIKKDS
ncbi:MAG TPA: YetF domain-containing protein [Chthoniobacterales bacterium]|nr:YetF domain-containing protein [Chthoniobacterales bacterium]